MNSWQPSVVAVIVAGGVLCAGCQATSRFPVASASPAGITAPDARVVLAAYASQSKPQTRPDATPPGPKAPSAKPDTLPGQPQASSTQNKQDGKPRAPGGYTAPSAAIRQAALLAIAFASSEDDDTEGVAGGGKELAESSVVGRPGLAAPQPSVGPEPPLPPGQRPPGLVTVGSRPGLQEGPASGLGFASQFNVLTPQTNPLSGPMGRCRDLAGAGFFGGREANCLRRFRPQ